MNVQACVEQSCSMFEDAGLYYGHGTDNPWDEAVYLVFTVLGLPFGDDDSSQQAVAQRQVTTAEWQRIETLARRRCDERLPMAYVLGEAWFAGLPFYVDERVLVPRSPIAELILQQYQPLLSAPPSRVLDLCTGSGCIGIATALVFPEARVDLADISADALAVAQQNIIRHGLQDRVRIVCSDLFADVSGAYDLIVSNPPYVSAEEVAELPPEYQREPALGLLSDEDGLAIPLQILRQASKHLTPAGVLVLELGFTWSLLDQRYPQWPVTWLEFDSGGEGVLAIARDALIRAER
ncbi:50S ribosomal protein L3 N(5)-glutamine methyltransferase [Pseudohongiella sp.]|uniref:Methyltransferase small domain-containing protein n=1 Tax=marine sediment metagenome TaxID=412755 RepID=A0A0F9W365_9ZZZZ|nr:50S ribosomal protein L3 N(5)-glutamine methyltransferase [Pseudohongiella sp.]HDZ09059.1 50S ribosomal protein L3 N(5)-glutamine methyltransferase [Pseudohongiella sp.]HEA62744.1 50S ribosomal protein L3 N(5)-glutamine methyltransferase [Pseudohongiella sp.]